MVDWRINSKFGYFCVMRVLFFTLLILYVLVIPVGLCFLRDLRPGLFCRSRILLWIAGLTVFSWCGVVGAILIPYYCGIFCPRGPELVFALFFGWSYLWFAAIPVFTIYGVLRLIDRLIGWLFRRAKRGGI